MAVNAADTTASQIAELANKKPRTLWGDAWRRFQRHRLAIFGSIVILIITVGVIIGPYVWKVSREDLDFLDTNQHLVREARWAANVRPVFKRVDTCAAEFATQTAYLYSTYDEECEADPTDRKKIMVLGGGPNRIGQGIEFDYCCV
ncbi:MAG: carbamoyl phosphate synthase large subunit, partial [Chloroflexia bacterium]|nr:carbamoyl phosphate synthase large subunit [Chloroflexia bacterium]